MISYHLDIQGMNKLQAAFQRSPQLTMSKLTTAMNKSLVRLKATAKELVPVDNGTLRGSILIDPLQISGNTIIGTVGTDLNYSEYQERGTGIYGPYGTPIRPKTKKVLAWQKNGKRYFAKEVKGSRPRWYMRGSLERNTNAVQGYFDTAAAEIVRELGGGA